MKMTWITGLCGIAIAGLTACGPLQQNNARTAVALQIFQNLAGKVTGSDSDVVVDSGAGTQPASSMREQIEAVGAPLLRISVISSGITGVVSLAGQNGSKVTWVSDAQTSFTFDDGLAVGTRGFGDDLMGSDVAGVKRSFNGGGSHLRTIDFLNSLAQIERHTYQCQTVQTGRETITIFERAYATNVYEEVCSGDTGDFKNTYWRDSSGVIWQSRQWISAGIGYIGYQRL